MDSIENLQAENLRLRRLVYRMTAQLQGNFWRCMKCKHIVHSYRQVHPCPKCKNGGDSGWWTCVSVDEWEKLHPMPDDFLVGCGRSDE